MAGCLSVGLSGRMSFCLSGWQGVYLFVTLLWKSVLPFVIMAGCLSVCLSGRVSIYWSAWQGAYLFVIMAGYPSFCLSGRVSFYLFVNLIMCPFVWLICLSVYLLLFV